MVSRKQAFGVASGDNGPDDDCDGNSDWGGREDGRG